MKVLLVCAAGMSTSLLTTKMIENGGPDDVVEALPVNELQSNIDRFDVVLLGPQIKFRLKEVEKVAGPKGIPVGVVDMRVYGMMDGKSPMEQARKLLAT